MWFLVWFLAILMKPGDAPMSFRKKYSGGHEAVFIRFYKKRSRDQDQSSISWNVFDIQVCWCQVHHQKVWWPFPSHFVKEQREMAFSFELHYATATTWHNLWTTTGVFLCWVIMDIFEPSDDPKWIRWSNRTIHCIFGPEVGRIL
jgi:hypothetical protein